MGSSRQPQINILISTQFWFWRKNRYRCSAINIVTFLEDEEHLFSLHSVFNESILVFGGRSDHADAQRQTGFGPTYFTTRYVNATGQLVMEAADPAIIMFKDGLELRLAEFKEDCKRIQQVERKLQAKIDSAVSEYEHTVQDVSNIADGRILKRLREQQRLIDLQQAEIDEIRHEKNCLSTETQRLRELTN